jgi:hypothetical protein
VPRTALVGAFFVALVLGLFGPSLVGGKVLSAADVVWFQPPFFVDRPADLVRPSNNALADPVEVFGPDLWHTREALHGGSSALWNPNAGAGRPLLASQQHAPLFPTQWLVYILPFWQALAWIAALKLLAAALGTYLLCRSHGLARGPAAMGGTTFAFSAYMVIWLEHPHTNAWLLLPWLALAARTVLRNGGPAAVLALSALLGLLLLAGHPESAAIVLFALAAYAGFELLEARREGRLRGRSAAARGAWLGAAFVGGVLLSAIVTLPVLELFRHGFSDPRGGSPPPAGVLYSWVFPELWSRPDKLFEVSPDPRGPFNYPERTAYLGALPALLALGGLAWRPARAQVFFVVLGAVALAIVMPTPLNALVRALPGGDSVALTRMLIVVTFAGAMLAAFGLQRLLDAPLPSRRRMLVVMAALGALPLLWLAGHTGVLSEWRGALGQLPTVEVDERSADVVQLGAVWRWALLALGGVAALAVALRSGPRARMAVAGLALAITAFDLVTLDRGYHPQVEEARADPPAPAQLRAARARAGSGRVMGADLSLFPNLATRYDIRDARAHDHPVIDRYQRLFAALGGGPPGRPVIPLNAPGIDRMADLFAVRYVVFPQGFIRENPGALPRAWMAHGWRSVQTTDEALLTTVGSAADLSYRQPAIEGAPPAPAGAPPAPSAATILVDQDARVDIAVQARRPGYLILADSFYPGWQATVDGAEAPILAANLAFRAVRVPAGEHRVSFRYRPSSVVVGAAVSGMTAYAMALTGGVLWWRRRRRTRASRVSADPAGALRPWRSAG